MSTSLPASVEKAVEGVGEGLVAVRHRDAAVKISEEKKKRESSPQEGENEEKNKCGVIACFLNVMERLPAIGEDDMEETSKDFEESLRFGAWQVIQLIIPVFICMAVVVAFQLSIAVYYRGPQQVLLYIPFDESSSSSGKNFLFGVVNAIVFIALVLVMTTVLVLLFKYNCNKAIFVWLLVTSGTLMFMASSIYFVEILMIRVIVIDWFTFSFFVWNFGSLGLMVIHWKGPLRLQQAYLILNSAIVAIVLIKFLPEWTTWIILAAISVYDLFAVLCPKGPLRILVETAKERGDIYFPSLIYSSTMMWTIGMADVNKKSTDNQGTGPKGQTQSTSSHSSTESEDSSRENGDRGSGDGHIDEGANTTKIGTETAEQSNSGDRIEVQEAQPTWSTEENKEEEEDEEEKRGFKLGLGDFIFYSVLVGKAANISQGNWVIIFSCFVAILIGLCLTSLILGIVRRALPALPISIVFGLVFYFTSQYILAPYIEVLNVNQVFI